MTLKTTPLILDLWRGHEPEVLDLPGMRLGTAEVAADAAEQAADAYAQGARRVTIREPVDLTGRQDAVVAMRIMNLVRELTSYGTVVDWRLVLGADDVDGWRALSHLYPPSALSGFDGAEAALSQWTTSFYICKCVYRLGPGFVQVRDRRYGSLRCSVIDDPAWLSVIHLFLAGGPRDAAPEHIVADFEADGLVGRVADLLWWMPYRARRWPYPSTVV
ncbi:DUF5825 family protein [Embleya sp. NPDC005575]|uniref:DUF5825 family protein n=1 Tax=Embleya sp. NPDC005575 TaxID=3156892 RepID=UPI0033BC3B82